MKRLRKLPLRIWAILPLTIIFSAVVFRLTWNIPGSIATISKVVLGLAIGVAAGGYFFLLLLIRPGLTQRLKSRLARIGVTAVVTGGLAALTIHTIRFLPSPEAAHPFSKVMAILLLAALISFYPVALKYIWAVWRREEKG